MAETNAAPAAPAVSSGASNTSAAAPKADNAAAPKASAVPAVKVDENGVAAETPKKLWKLNVNGKEVEYDASNEDKMKADLQKVFGIEEKD